jgi:pimeloyl-ACP methyl ester carboxylesterase
MQQHTVTAGDGETIRVWVSGQGPPLVLLHEWASSHRIWEPFAHHLADRFTIYRWDARGHGGHGEQQVTPGCAVSLDAMADDLAALLAHFRLDRPTVLGHSMGALTLWAFIARHGCSRIGRLGFIDQSPKLVTDADWHLGIYGDWPVVRDSAFIAAMRRDFVGAVLGLIGDGLNRPARERFTTGHPGQQRLRNYLRLLDPAPLIAVWPTLSAADLRPALAAIDVPTLLVYGEESNYYPPATGRYVRDAIARAELIVYEGGDHSPHIGQPARFVDDLTRFARG